MIICVWWRMFEACFTFSRVTLVLQYFQVWPIPPRGTKLIKQQLVIVIYSLCFISCLQSIKTTLLCLVHDNIIIHCCRHVSVSVMLSKLKKFNHVPITCVAPGKDLKVWRLLLYKQKQHYFYCRCQGKIMHRSWSDTFNNTEPGKIALLKLPSL